MNSRTRVLKAVAHEETDRVPFDYWARDDVTRRLMERMGAADREDLLQKLNIDMRHIPVGEHHPGFEERKTGVLGGNSESSGQRFRMHGDGTFENPWGVVKRLGSGGLYEEWVRGPFSRDRDLDSFGWPGTDIFDSVEAIKSRVSAYGGRYALMGRINLPFKMCWHMRGLENFLCDMLLDPGYAAELISRLALYEKKRGLRFVRAGVDIVGMYGDIAMQDRMLVKPNAWRAIEKPVLAEVFRSFKEENPEVLVFFHSDGDITEVIPDLIEIGVNIINPIQPECMDPVAVKEKYGDRITMHGTISIQKTLPKGTVHQVRREVRERIETCGKGGGLIICPSNLVQNDTPLENIEALYDISQRQI